MGEGVGGLGAICGSNVEGEESEKMGGKWLQTIN